MTTRYLTWDEGVEVKRLLERLRIPYSDCTFVHVEDETGSPGWIEMRGMSTAARPFGGRRMAIVALTLDGRPVDAWEVEDA